MKKILIANRGEIALRIMRTCREMNIRTVAVYSEADRNAPFVRFSDEAVCIGPPPSSESYLRADKIISAAKKTHADAIHPGYGFLSENSDFAKQAASEGLIFIGPPPEAIALMGDKTAAKACAKKLGIPLVPGSGKPLINFEEARKTAGKTGYPILLKAAAGGGGKGMRIVFKPEDLEENFQRAGSEAKSAFGDDSVFIEKYIESPRHIEFQLLGDEHGNIIHLFERECSIQRRHQKVMEEAPSSILSPELRNNMGECAVKIARASGYRNAGTVEFLVDEKMNFYFLEMNTRLQVEHPVTEYITGLDLVKEQIHIAEGNKLSLKQEDVKISGHAIEARIYAENPYENFFPDNGKLNVYRRPGGANIRLDDGYEEGMEIPIYYDPMISKLIAFGNKRDEAINRLICAIDDYTITGVETTLPFCRFVLGHPAFVSGKFDTHFVQKYFTPGCMQAANRDEAEAAAALASMIFSKKHHLSGKTGDSAVKWKLRKKYREYLRAYVKFH